MIGDLIFSWRAIRLNLRDSAELRGSFLFSLVGMMINNTSFIILWGALASSVGPIGGWTFVDVVGLQGFAALSFGLAFSFGAGLRRIPELTASGALDSFLLAPRPLLVRIATSSFSVGSFGDVFFGLICLAFFAAGIDATPTPLLLIGLLAVAAALTMAAAAIGAAAAGFFFIEPLVVSHSLFELFLAPSLFHGGAIQGGLRFFLTFAVPSLLVGTLPVEAVRSPSLGGVLTIVATSAAWLTFAVWLFGRARRRYESSGFFTFGH